MSDSNATELLRGELASNGIEYEDAKYNFETHITVWNADNATFVFIDGPNHDGELHVENCTSEQAVAATLGAGECEFVSEGDNPPKCSACGWQADAYDCDWLKDGGYEYDGNFCKNCGAKVVGE